MRVPVPFLLVAGVVTAVVVGGGVVALGRDDDDEPTPPAQESFTTTPLSEFDTTGLVVARGPFCDAIDDRQVDAVLGSVPDALEWENGDSIDLTGTGTEDVVHEFGCSYAVRGRRRRPGLGLRASGRRDARRPAAGQGGRQVDRLRRSAPGRRSARPTLALTCTKDGVTRASYRGLFGDAWLVCEVELADAAATDIVDVAGRWCVGALQAAAAPPNG